MFFENLDKACKENNKTVTGVVVSLGISKSNVTNWKSGTSPSGDIIVKLSELLNVSADYLLTGKEKSSATELSANEHEMLKLFNKLPVKDQDRIIGRLEIMVESVEAEEHIG